MNRTNGVRAYPSRTVPSAAVAVPGSVVLSVIADSLALVRAEDSPGGKPLEGITSTDAGDRQPRLA
jgi:hypothetical protein